MKRIFIAVSIDPSNELLALMSELKSVLSKDRIKWVDHGIMHLTLSFLGDTEEKRIPELSAILKDCCAGSGSFYFKIKGMGVFRNLRDLRVIWAGISDDGNLERLYNKIREGLNEKGFPTEERPFSPHLTLGRVKSVGNTNSVKALIEKYREKEFQSVQVTEIILYESILMQTGPVYKPLSRFSLQ
ncbi:MAG: RNA 2',3'-cyclic phosphodiesterase [Bacteroidales bacterium]|nr:RNA 2',3'-cyclic phosphodiesterase [Bacteroidales bacterium]